jgi:1,4-dihydroxy-6-naphthoate synthase
MAREGSTLSESAAKQKPCAPAVMSNEFSPPVCAIHARKLPWTGNILCARSGFPILAAMDQESRLLTLGHSPDPDDAFMFYALAKELIPTGGFRFEHVLQDIQTLNERATRGELDISAVSIHAYAYVSDKYALLPSGASMGDGYGPMLVAKQKYSREEMARKKIAVPGTMTSAFLALQLYLGRSARDLNFVVVPFDQIFAAVRDGRADIGLIIHEGQLTYGDQGLVLCEDLGVWWGSQNNGLPLPLGGNVIHKRFSETDRSVIARILEASIRYSLEHRAEAVQHALQYARDMGKDLADKFVGMYVNHWTLDYGQKGRESIRRFLGQAHERGLIAHRQELEFVT